MIYWVNAPDLTFDELEDEFRRDYDGEIPDFSILDVRTDEERKCFA